LHEAGGLDMQQTAAIQLAGVCGRLQACVSLAAKPGWRSQVADVHWRAPAE